MTKLVAVALVALAAPARAETISIDAGASYLTFDLHDSIASTPALAVALAAGTPWRRNLYASLRGHVAFGDGHTTALGPHFRHDVGAFYIGWGLSIANVVGPDAPDRAHGLGLTGELRLSITFGSIALAVHARPTWVFASDSHQARVDCARELGATLGVRL